MIEPQQRPVSRVSVEDLIRLKRAERPPAEFWVEFERSLRAKQLAAIVEKRSFWRSFGAFSRWTMPLGAAAAALSITFFAMNRPQSGAPRSADMAKAETTQKAVQPEISPARQTVVTEVASSESPTVTMADRQTSVAMEVAVQPVAAHAAASVSIPVADSSPHIQAASVTEQIAGISGDSRPDQSTTNDQFASVSQVETPSVASIGAYFDRAIARFGEVLPKDKESVVEPLSQVTAPRDARRARLLAFTSTVDNRSPQYTDSTSVVRSRERITSHLNDEALYESLHRLGLKGNLVSIQF